MLKKLKKSDEELKYDFLPSALEIIEKPASPLGKILIYIISIFILSAVLWACFAKIDEVSICSGQVMPVDGVQTINSNLGGKIVNVYKQQGDKVKKGEIIYEIENTLGFEQIKEIKDKIKLNQLKLALVNCKINNQNSDSVFEQYKDLDSNELEAVKLQEKIDSQNKQKEEETYNKSLSDYDVQIEDATKKYNDEVNKLNSYDADHEEQTLKDIMDNSETKEDIQKNVEDYKENIENIKEQKEECIRQRASTLESERLSNIQQRNDYESTIKSLQDNITEMDQDKDKFYIRSNIDGEIVTLKYNTSGAYINAGESVVEIIENDSELEIQAMLPNKDVSKVTIGDRVVIKLEAYDYQKYGYLAGEISYIAPNAIVDENLGTVYKIKISFNKNEKENIQVISGMNASLEINTGKIRIIDYFLNPFEKCIDESLKG